METAAGLGAMGFWIFLAAIIVAGIWFDVRKRESQQETLRRVVESGQQIDPVVIDKMVAAGGGSSRPDRDYKISGMIVGFIAPGMPILGWFLARFNEDLFGLMLGVGMLMAFVSAGLYIAGKVYERWYNDDLS